MASTYGSFDHHSVTVVVQDHKDLAFMDYSSLVMHSSLKEGGEASEILHGSSKERHSFCPLLVQQ
jgi:hypothetical protein